MSVSHPLNTASSTSLTSKSTLSPMSAIPTESDYSPSEHSHRGSSESVLESHLQSLMTNSDTVRSSFRCSTTRYGNTKQQIYELFDNDISDSPIFIYIHGGFWHIESVNCKNSCFMVPTMHSAGISVITIGYDLCPTVSIPDIVLQVRSAIVAILDRDGVRKRPIVFCGHSAGAHLILAALTPDIVKNSRIRGLILVSGLYDLRPLIDLQVNETLKLDNDIARECSPQLNFDPATLISADPLHGIEVKICLAKYDSNAFKHQSVDLYEKLKKGDVNCNLYEFDDVDHFEITDFLIYSEHGLTRLILNTMMKMKHIKTLKHIELS